MLYYIMQYIDLFGQHFSACMCFQVQEYTKYRCLKSIQISCKINLHMTYPCKFPIRAQARKAGPPKKSFKSSLLTLKPWDKKEENHSETKKERKLLKFK